MKSFKWTAGLIGGVFFAVLAVVIVSAYSRKSGNTGMDAAKMHIIRSQVVER